MLRTIYIKFKKTIFHLLTCGNADIAFYTEAYVASNKEWIMKKPLLFALNLVKININCLILRRNYSFKELLPGRKCLARIHRRPKVYQFAADIINYPYIITDVFHSLLELSVDLDTIYEKIEASYQLPGFTKLRRKKANTYKSITSIYEEISKKLSVTISKDIEINMLKEHLVLNPYVKKVLEIAAYNKSAIIGILETSYSKEDMEYLLSEYSIKLTDLYVSSEYKLPFYQMRNKFIKNPELMNDNFGDKFIIVSANYSKAFQHTGGTKFSKKYYRSSKEIMRSIPIPDMSKEFKEVYQTIAGIELFGGQYSHKNIYEITYLYLAPAVYALLEETHQRAVNSGTRVIALCDPECIFADLYNKYFGSLETCIWSGFVGSLPVTREDWSALIEDNHLIKAYPADRIAYALGFSFQKQLLKDCKNEFIDAALNNFNCQSRVAISSYLKNYLRNDTKLVIVDPMPGLSSLSNFYNYAQEINPLLELEMLSMSNYLKKNASELHILHRILQMDIPYMIGIYDNRAQVTNANAVSQEEFTFVQPQFINEQKKKIINHALSDYCHSFHTYQSKNKSLRMYPSDINSILDHAKEGLILINEELGGYLE